MPSYESAYLLCQQGALVRLASIIITFQVFLCLSLLALVLGLLNLMPMGPLSQLNLALSIFGLSPFALTVLAWRGVEKICSAYIRKYVSKHLSSTPSS